MKVLHWYPNLLGGGGVAGAVVGLAAAQARAGAEVHLACYEGEERSLYGDRIPEGAVLHRIAYARRLHLGGNRLVRPPARGEMARLRDIGADLVHVHGGLNADNLWVYGAVARASVLSPHGAYHPAVIARARGVKSAWAAFEERRASGGARALHALCPAEAAAVKGLLPGAEVYVAPQGGASVTAARTSPRPPGAEGPRRVLSLGRLDVRGKGLDVLVKAFAEAAGGAGAPPMSLAIMGPDPGGAADELRALAGGLGVADAVTVSGAVDRSAVPAALAAADLYAQLSRNEGFGLSLAEALLCGVPALASDEVGLASFEFIARLPHVTVCEAGDVGAAAAGIRSMLGRADELRAAGSAAAEEVARFLDWDRIAAVHLERYGRLVYPEAAA
ncbi:MAG: glycosyltransferase [Actinobacteria bacterium]|nr:MAG: glycosyltransferase [Actinomycetota bacterium]